MTPTISKYKFMQLRKKLFTNGERKVTVKQADERLTTKEKLQWLENYNYFTLKKVSEKEDRLNAQIKN